MIEPYSWQVPGVQHLVEVLKTKNCAVCGSDTGSGKTIVALAVAQSLNRLPLVICPKSTINQWRDTAAAMGIPLLETLNIEKLKTGKTRWVKKINPKRWEWNLSDTKDLLIIDEAHRCGGQKSQNAHLLASAKLYGLKTLCLSATLADSPLRLRALGFLLDLHRFRDFFSWAKKMGCKENNWGGLEFTRYPVQARARFMLELHNAIYPSHGYRISIEDIPEFPETAIFAQAYDMGKHDKAIQKIYDKLDHELKKPDHEHFNPLTAILRARQRVELFKVPLLLELIEEYVIEEGKSVVVFVSFRETIEKLLFETKGLPGMGVSVIMGNQSQEERTNQQNQFLQDKTRICLCTTAAGGVGLDLDDKHGKHPRIALITPSYSAVELKQALGRIHRATSKSKSLQYIIFAAGTVEQEACKAVQTKLGNLALLNDADLGSSILQTTKERTKS